MAQDRSDPPGLLQCVVYGIHAAFAFYKEKRSCIICDKFHRHRRALFQPFPKTAAHSWCEICLRSAIQIAFKTRTRAQCCDDIPLFWLRHFDPALAKKYQLKVWQPTTPNATYCSNPICNTFSNNKAAVNDILTCKKCSTQTCTKCKEAAHPDESCDQGKDRQKMLKLAGEKKWTPCPACGLIVERAFGCRRMVCARCKVQYCYMCGRTWKECFEGKPCTPNYMDHYANAPNAVQGDDDAGEA
ncbi:MAG: hypothetical protein L6R42_010526 [Xanthoria sp. 1 TBL-2021]|nr:MAG: hypothetical protein L6R42_010526 [Xanthoria sp. 1 TBL-2021]